LPHDPHTEPTPEQWQEVIEYNKLGDLPATHELLRQTEPILQALTALSNTYGLDLRSLAAPTVVEQVFRSIYRRSGGGREPLVHSSGESIEYRPLPGVVRPSSPEAAAWYDAVVGVPLPIIHGVGPRLPIDLANYSDPVVASLREDKPRIGIRKVKVRVGDLTLKVGEGGMHSHDGKIMFYADDTYRLVSADVSSYYASLISLLGIMPDNFGDVAADAYRQIYEERRGKKLAAKSATGAEKDALEAQSAGLKLVTNAFSGQLMNPFCVLYDPRAYLQITLTGQLMLINLIERLQAVGVRVISVNTDGIFCRVPRGTTVFEDAIGEWELMTRMNMEVEDVARLVLHKANNYCVLGLDGSIKAKGSTFINDFVTCTYPSNFTSPDALIVGRAITSALLEDITPEKVVYMCKDLTMFCRVLRRSPGVVRRTIGTKDGPQEQLDGIVRYYHAKDSSLRIATTETSGEVKVGETREKVRLAMMIDDAFPADVDKSQYVKWARKTIQSIRTYRHLDPAIVPLHSLAQELLKFGLSPVPKQMAMQDGQLRAKAVRAGTQPERPTLLHSWFGIDSGGSNTGPEVGILIVDVDGPERFAKAVGLRKIQDPWGQLAGCLVSVHGAASPEMARVGAARCKLIFKFAADPGHPLTAARSRFLKRWGVEVFYGNGIPSLLGKYDDEGDFYRLDGEIGPAPEWLITMLTPPPVKVRGPKAVVEATEEGLDAAVAQFVAREPRLAGVRWETKTIDEGRLIRVAHCPCQDGGEDQNLRVGIGPNGPYIACFRATCDVTPGLAAKTKGRRTKKKAQDEDDLALFRRLQEKA
jgi:hypothetical protein